MPRVKNTLCLKTGMGTSSCRHKYLICYELRTIYIELLSYIIVIIFSFLLQY